MKIHIHNNKCTQEFSVKGFNGKKRRFGVCRNSLEVVYSRPHGNTDSIKALKELSQILQNSDTHQE